MDELMRWLGEQLDEDERVARAAKPGPWHEDGGVVYATHPTDEVVDYSESAEHIARHGPARVLREFEAKRQTLALLEAAEDRMDQAMRESDPDTYGQASAMAIALRAVIRNEACVYADRPGFREEWRP